MNESLGRSGSILNLLAVNANWVGLSFMWNAIHPILLPALLAPLVPESRKNSYLGLLTFTGLVIAMVLQPISGAMSDHWSSRFGRRRPLIMIGTILALVFLAFLGWAEGLTGLIVGYVGLQASSNLAQGPLQGLLRDRVPTARLGAATSMKVFLDLASLVGASFVAGGLMTSGRQGGSTPIVSIMALLFLSAMATILFNPEQATDRTEHFAPTSGGHSAALDLRATSSYWWLIGERAAFLLGVYGLQAFGQYYIRDALGLADAPQRTGNVLGIIGLTTILLVVAAGWLTDRHGAKPLLCAASLLAGTGLLLMMLTTDLRGLYGFGALLGAGIGLFLASNWALANQLAPGKGAGKYLGLTNLATAGAAALARLEGPAVDALNQWLPGQWWGYKGVFAFGAMCILFSLWFLLKVQVPAPKRPAQARPPG